MKKRSGRKSKSLKKQSGIGKIKSGISPKGKLPTPILPSKSEAISKILKTLNLRSLTKITFRSKRRLCSPFSILIIPTMTSPRLSEQLMRLDKSTLLLATIETTWTRSDILQNIQSDNGFRNSILLVGQELGEY